MSLEALFHFTLVPLVTLLVVVPWFAGRVRMSASLLVLGYLAHLAGALAMAYLQTTVLPGDAIGAYHPSGEAIALGFLDPFEAIDAGRSPIGSFFVVMATGIWYTLVGVNFYGLFVLSGTASFIAGCLMIYAARLTYGPGRGFRWLCLAALFLPSFLFWNGLYGKEHFVALGTAMTVWGVGLFQRREMRRAAPALALGLLLTFLVRPHMAVISVLALGGAIALARGRGFGPVFVGAAVLGLFAYLSADFVASYVGLSAFGTEEIAATLSERNAVLQGRGSAPGIAVTPGGGIAGLVATLPLAIAAMLAMPFPGQLGSSPFQLFAALETLLVLFFVVRLAPRSLLRLARAREPALAFAWFYVVLFLLILSVPLAANFGIMVRQRVVMWIPLLFALFAGWSRAPVPVRASRAGRRHAVPSPAPGAAA